MELISQCALRIAKVVWRPGHGGFAFTVVCKATFELQPEASPLAAAQEPVNEADVYTSDGGSLAIASDLVPFKKRPEVLVIGHAHAPEGRPVPSLVARLAVGEIDKSIQVVGDRYFDRHGRLSEPARFTRMPLAWEHAAGGPGTPNPVGIPLNDAARVDPSGHVPAPNLLPAGLSLTSRSDIVQPVGFGPLAPMWPSRAGHLHRHVTWWNPGRWHEQPLKADIDLDYFNAAPPDQQRALPFGEETLYLENLHPRFARLPTRLAPVTPIATVDHGSGAQPLQLRCDTLLIDADRGLAMLVWRAHVLLDQLDRPGRVVVTGPAVPQVVLPAWVRNASAADATVVPEAFMVSPAVLPFSGTAAESAPRREPPSGESALGLPFAPPPSNEEDVEKTLVPALKVPASALPFDSSVIERAQQREVTPQRSASGLPFVVTSLGEERDGQPTPRHRDSPSWQPSHGTDSPWTTSRGSLPLETQPPQGGLLAESATFSFAAVSSPVSEIPAPPSLLGALAAVSDSSFEERHRDESPAIEGSPPAEAFAAEAEQEVAFDAFPPERCGAIAARLACDEDSTGNTLNAEHLNAAQWKRVHDHWLGRIRDEAARSRKKLLSNYDSAYVSALEAKCGPIALDDYARLAEAAERSAVAELLAERKLPEGAWPHIHRVWIGRLVKDVQLSKQVRVTIDELRAAGQPKR